MSDENEEVLNEKEFLELIETYKSITLEELEEASQRYETYNEIDWGGAILSEITGFGSKGTCTLCLATRDDTTRCHRCIYFIISKAYCHSGVNATTFKDIEVKADNIEELYAAIQARIEHMQIVYKTFKEKQNEEID